MDTVEAAKAAGLRYVYDSRPGIRRLKSRGGFRYLGPDGRPVRDQETLARIKSLVIPPAWTGVWICPLANGHLQATGRDARGRKQSRYHPRWRATRDEVKYERMLQFGKALPGIRRRVKRDLALPGMPREKVLATIVSLMETTLIRVGNVEYAKANHSYGLTTMKRHHVKFVGGRLRFDFDGKSGVHHTIDVCDKRLVKIVKQSRDLPGYELFEYVDEDGALKVVDSGDVNEYLRETTDEHFTAKDFRTWAGTVLACAALHTYEAFGTEREAKKNVVEAIAEVAARLGNTPAVCRKCYVHPAVLDCYLQGKMKETAVTTIKRMRGLRDEEMRVVRLLQAATA
jgi:DNA topoisomerase-1